MSEWVRERRADEIKKKDREKKFLADVHDKFFQFLKLVAWFWLLIANPKMDNGRVRERENRHKKHTECASSYETSNINHWMSSTNNQRFYTSRILSRKRFSDFFFLSLSLAHFITKNNSSFTTRTATNIDDDDDVDNDEVFEILWRSAPRKTWFNSGSKWKENKKSDFRGWRASERERNH